MIHLKIDNKEISVPEGTSVLEAAKTIGIQIPSMCYSKGFDNCPSCMVCLVKDKKSGNFMASCALKAAEGMEMLSEVDEVRDARREAMELLMSDHVGDCEAPCSLSCPAGMDIPQMNRLIASRKFEEALEVVKKEIALPHVLGYICPAPCEKACRRKQVDGPVAICLLKRSTAVESNTNQQIEPRIVSDKKSTDKQRVAIIGAGPAGLASAFYLLQKGYQCVIFDKNENAGGNLRYSIPDTELPKHALDEEVEIIRQMGASFSYQTTITADNFNVEIKQKFDAVIVATGDLAFHDHLSSLFEKTKSGIVADEATMATSIAGVFVCGSAIRPHKMAVRSVAQGKAAAISAHYYLLGEEIPKPVKMFNSRFDKLLPAEFDEYLKESVRGIQIVPSNGRLAGFSAEQAVAEAARCMHCDCRKMDNCKLRIYSDTYHVDRKKYLLGNRKTMVKYFQHDLVVYEPEKCIKCGLCVEITLLHKEPIGLAYAGRGFDVHIDVPFGQSVKEAIEHTAKECVEACPTGALAFK